MNSLTKTMGVALIGGASLLASPANAVPLSASLALKDAAPSPFEEVRWRGGWGGFALAAGIIGGAIAASSYRYSYGYPAYGYGYGYPAYGYGYPAYRYSYGYAPAYSYGYAPAYYGYGPAYYSYGYAYPRVRSGIYVRRAYRRW